MFTRAVRRGVTAGAVAGLAYGLYVAVVATPLIRYAETYETGSGESAVPELVSALASVAGGVLYGILLGTAAFGVGYFFLEPTLPGGQWAKRYLLAGVGFLVVSGAPWLLLPPVPPGVEESLPTAVRLGWYMASMAVGAVASGLAIAAYNRLEGAVGDRVAPLGATVGLVPLGLMVLVAPPNQLTGAVPEAVATVFTVSTVVGQLGLWALLATVHRWLVQRRATQDGPNGITSMNSDSLARETRRNE